MTDDEHGVDVEEDTELDTADDDRVDSEEIEEGLGDVAEELGDKLHQAMESEEREDAAEEETNPDKHRDEPSQVS